MRRLPVLPLRIVSALAIVALAMTLAGGVAQANQRIEIVDYGIYDHVVTEVVPEPKVPASARPSPISACARRRRPSTPSAGACSATSSALLIQHWWARR